MGRKRTGISILFLALGILFVFPFILLVMNSFKSYNDMMVDFLALPKKLYFGNYSSAVTKMNFMQSVINSMIITVGTMLLATFVSFLGAYGVFHIKGKLGKFLYLFFALGQIVPFHSIMIALSVQLNNWGLSDRYITVICLYAGFHCCFGIFTYVGFLKSIPKDLECYLSTNQVNNNYPECIIFPLDME